MQGDELLERGGQLASQQAALQGPVRLASPLEPGEDVAGVRLEDADHWVAVYSELLEFKCDLLREIDRQARAMGQEGAEEISYDRRAFMLELQRLQLHLEYWLQRRERLRECSVPVNDARRDR